MNCAIIGVGKIGNALAQALIDGWLVKGFNHPGAAVFSENPAAHGSKRAELARLNEDHTVSHRHP